MRYTAGGLWMVEDFPCTSNNIKKHHSPRQHPTTSFPKAQEHHFLYFLLAQALLQPAPGIASDGQVVPIPQEMTPKHPRNAFGQLGGQRHGKGRKASEDGSHWKLLGIIWHHLVYGAWGHQPHTYWGATTKKH